ncbi:hypothetical protein DNTS_024583 [Danionella cerebrum]|uniref:Cytoplasmic dynein 2 light intermediate chain 1 n=1 Tax=Danionella cerebrum TaxID=2873325 RepID=A0A553NHL6_9TELE|nr:hypothetical protein DNTS_024583 [Danionella translucida]
MMPKSSNTLLWDVAAAEVRSRESRADEEDEENLQPSSQRTVFFIGSKAGGKTTILLRFLDRDEPAKPTLALEYTFGRRGRGHNMAKDIAHLWELGGGISLSDLVQIPITADNVCSLSVVLVVDLSKPNALWETMEGLLLSARNQVEKACGSVQKAGESRRVPRVLHKDYPDRELISAFPVPLLIVGSKFDVFQFVSSKSETTMSRSRAFMNHLAFGTEKPKHISTDASKPLAIPAGSDSFTQIGPPVVSDVDIGTLHAKNPLDLWKKAFERIFPPENSKQHTELKDPAKDPQYSEPLIDSVRAQKDQVSDEFTTLTPDNSIQLVVTCARVTLLTQGAGAVQERAGEVLENFDSGYIES